MNIRCFISAIYSGGSFITELVSKMFHKSGFKTNIQNNNVAINEILLYGADSEEHIKQIGLNNLLCIYYMILHANESVDVCVPSLVSETFAKCLIKVQQKNKEVKIRITIHNSDNFSNLKLLAEYGIEVKIIINPTVRLEHEFLLIDASGDFQNAVAVMGSLDYETKRVNCNRDATMLTSETAVVTALKREFDRVWNSVPDKAYEKSDNNPKLVY